jgi:hypothetical protein
MIMADGIERTSPRKVVVVVLVVADTATTLAKKSNKAVVAPNRWIMATKKNMLVWTAKLSTGTVFCLFCPGLIVLKVRRHLRGPNPLPFLTFLPPHTGYCLLSILRTIQKAMLMGWLLLSFFSFIAPRIGSTSFVVVGRSLRIIIILCCVHTFSVGLSVFFLAPLSLVVCAQKILWPLMIIPTKNPLNNTHRKRNLSFLDCFYCLCYTVRSGGLFSQHHHSFFFLSAPSHSSACRVIINDCSRSETIQCQSIPISSEDTPHDRR